MYKQDIHAHSLFEKKSKIVGNSLFIYAVVKSCSSHMWIVKSVHWGYKVQRDEKVLYVFILTKLYEYEYMCFGYEFGVSWGLTGDA